MALPTIPHDKALHVIYGAIAFVFTFFIATWLALHVTVLPTAVAAWLYAWRVELGVAAGLGMGLAKEAHDAWRIRTAGAAHSVQKGDVVATLAGALLAAVPAWMAAAGGGG